MERLIVVGAGRLLADTTVAELSASNASLEDAFLALTSASADYRGVPGVVPPGRHSWPPGARLD